MRLTGNLVIITLIPLIVLRRKGAAHRVTDPNSCFSLTGEEASRIVVFSKTF